MLQKFGVPLIKKLASLHSLVQYTPALFGLLTIGTFLLLQPVPAQSHNNSGKTNHTVAKKPQVIATPKTSAPVAPAPVPPPAPSPPAVPEKPVLQAGTPKAEPVVTPAPDSSVSGLAPTTPPAPPAPAPSQSQTPPPQTTTGYTSTNWAGYLALNANFTTVSGSWIVPAATGNGVSTSAESTWVGIGGVTAGDLIQTGTVNIISASGQISTTAWYEMLPSSSINIPSMTVAQGDSMTASVTEVSNGQWAIYIIDNTTGQSFSITVAYASSHSSAEWIEEDPSYSSGRQIPFADFHLAVFSNSSAVANGSTVNLSTSTAQPVTMVNRSGQPIAVPSAISGGTSFSVSQ